MFQLAISFRRLLRRFELRSPWKKGIHMTPVCASWCTK